MENNKKPCSICNKEYKNVSLHIVKKHKMAKCVGCNELIEFEKNPYHIIFELGDEKKGKYWESGLCLICGCWCGFSELSKEENEEVYRTFKEKYGTGEEEETE